MSTSRTRHPVIEEDLGFISAADLPWGRFEGRTVLVSGASGFLPAYMVETLLYLNEGCHRHAPTTVVGLVRNEAKARRRFAAYDGRPDLRILVQDVCEETRWDGAVDFIVHAASAASPKYFGSDPVGTLSANVLGTRHLRELARARRSSGFLFVSSGEVYGRVDPEKMPLREDTFGCVDPLDVRSCYGESKRMGENMCVCWGHQHGVPAVIARPFHTYGPGMSLDADFVADVVRRRPIVLHSDGLALRPFCYITDVILGFFTLLLRGAVGHAYNLGNEHAEISIRDLAHLLSGLMPGDRLEVIHAAGTPAPGYLPSRLSRNLPDTTRARELGWSPKVGLEEGFRRTIRSFS